jgi:hypothetical protein
VCTGCAAGTFITDNGDKKHHHDAISDCQVCKKGQWSDVGSQTCTKCVAGKFLFELGIESVGHNSIDKCVICPAGKWALEDADKCEVCPAGMYLDDDGASASNHVSISSCKCVPKVNGPLKEQNYATTVMQEDIWLMMHLTHQSMMNTTIAKFVHPECTLRVLATMNVQIVKLVDI